MLAARVGVATRRWPSPLPGGHCTAAQGEGWSCSTPGAAQEDNDHFYRHRLFLVSSSQKSRFKSSHLVVVASGREVLVVWRPFETAHFLSVTL